MPFMIFMYVFYVLFRIVPCERIPVQVLFDSGATQSFVSLSLSKMFPESLGMLDCPLEVNIADEQSVQAS